MPFFTKKKKEEKKKVKILHSCHHMKEEDYFDPVGRIRHTRDSKRDDIYHCSVPCRRCLEKIWSMHKNYKSMTRISDTVSDITRNLQAERNHLLQKSGMSTQDWTSFADHMARCEKSEIEKPKHDLKPNSASKPAATTTKAESPRIREVPQKKPEIQRTPSLMSEAGEVYSLYESEPDPRFRSNMLGLPTLPEYQDSFAQELSARMSAWLDDVAFDSRAGDPNLYDVSPRESLAQQRTEAIKRNTRIILADLAARSDAETSANPQSVSAISSYESFPALSPDTPQGEKFKNVDDTPIPFDLAPANSKRDAKGKGKATDP